MVATVSIMELNGAGATETAKESGTIRYKRADNATVDTNTPLPIPTSGRTYSFEKWHRFKITGGTYTEISNIRWYCDGANGFVTGVTIWYATDSSFSQPSDPVTTNDPPQHDAVAMTEIWTKTSGSPVTLGAGPYSSSVLVGDHLVTVMEVDTNATTSGSTNSETFTWAYDEI